MDARTHGIEAALEQMEGLGRELRRHRLRDPEPESAAEPAPAEPSSHGPTDEEMGRLRELYSTKE